MLNWCSTHEVPWFKKGAMKGFAHPIKEGTVTVGWCNRPQDYVGEDLVEAAIKEGGVITSIVSKDLRDLGIKRQSSLKAATDIVGSMVKAGLIKEHIQTKVLDWAEVFFTYSNQDK